VLNDGKTGPRFVARSDLNMLVAARGREWTAAEYGAWVHTCGFTLQEIYHTKVHSKVEYGCCAPSLDEEKIMGKVTCAAPHLSIDEVKGK
jgi:hypothetical protein